MWNNSNGANAWSTAANWDSKAEPPSADDVTFPLGLAATITTTSNENALSLTFNDAYTLISLSGPDAVRPGGASDFYGS